MGLEEANNNVRQEIMELKAELFSVNNSNFKGTDDIKYTTYTCNHACEHY